MRAVAIGAIRLCAGVLHFRGVNLLGLVGVASDANFLRRRLRQNHFAVFCRLVANITLLFGEGRVNECLHQLRPVGLVRIMALQAIRVFKWLVLMRLGEIRVLHVMAIEAQRRNCLRQVVSEFAFLAIAGLVRDVASVAARV